MDQRPATKQDLLDLEGRMQENLRDMETRLLSAFYTFSRTNDVRMRKIEAEQIE